MGIQGDSGKILGMGIQGDSGKLNPNIFSFRNNINFVKMYEQGSKHQQFERNWDSFECTSIRKKYVFGS